MNDENNAEFVPGDLIKNVEVPEVKQEVVAQPPVNPEQQKLEVVNHFIWLENRIQGANMITEASQKIFGRGKGHLFCWGRACREASWRAMGGGRGVDGDQDDPGLWRGPASPSAGLRALRRDHDAQADREDASLWS